MRTIILSMSSLILLMLPSSVSAALTADFEVSGGSGMTLLEAGGTSYMDPITGMDPVYGMQVQTVPHCEAVCFASSASYCEYTYTRIQVVLPAAMPAVSPDPSVFVGCRMYTGGTPAAFPQVTSCAGECPPTGAGNYTLTTTRKWAWSTAPAASFTTTIGTTAFPPTRADGNGGIVSSSQTVITITNTGGSSGTVGLSTASPHFDIITPSSLTIPAGESRTVVALFDPTASGPLTGILNFTPSVGTIPDLSLTGNGTAMPSIGTLTAPDCTIPSGGNTCSPSPTLTWSVNNPISVNVQKNSASLSASPSGSMPITVYHGADPRNTVTVTDTGLSSAITPRGSCAGGSTWNSTICAPDAPSFTFTASPSVVTLGGSTNLTWSAVTGATSCTASGGAGWSGGKSLAGGTQVLSPIIDTTYTLSCTGPGGTTVRSPSVTVVAPDLQPTVAGVTLYSGMLINGQTARFTAQVRNTGTADTPSSFETKFEYRWGTSGPWSPLASSIFSKGVLGAGLTDPSPDITESIPFSTTGTFQIRYCTDSRGAGDVNEGSAGEGNNCTVQSFTVLNNSRPTASITGPVSGSYPEGTNITFTGTGADSDGTIGGYEWRDGACDSGGIILNNNQTFSTTALTPGVHTIYLRAHDNLGLWSNNCPFRTITIVQPNVISNAAPTLATGILRRGTNVTFNGTTRNSGTTQINTPFTSNFSYCWGAGCSSWTDISSHAATVPMNTLTNQTNTSASFNITNHGILRIQHCVDSAPSQLSESNEGDNCRTQDFTVNNVLPTAAITGPAAGSYPQGTNLTFTGSGSDVDGTIQGFEWQDGACMTGTILTYIAGTNPTYSTSALSPGTHTIYLRPVDDTGGWINPASCPSRTITIVQPNVISNAAPTLATGILRRGTNVTFSGTTRNTSGFQINTPFTSNFSYCWGAGCSSWTDISSHAATIPFNNATNQTNTSASFTIANHGTLRIQHCVDSAPSQLSETNEGDNCRTQDFTVNNVLPTASITGPASGSYPAGTNLTFTGSGSDVDGTIQGFEWQDGACMTGTILTYIAGTNPTYSTSALSPGTHTIYLRPVDDTGGWINPASCPSRTITIVPPDLQPTAAGVTFSSGSLLEGQTARFAAQVRNTATAGTIIGFETNFTYRWGNTGPWLPLASSIFSKGALGAGATAPSPDVSESIPLSGSGTFQVQYCTDSRGSGDIDEGSTGEGNNCAVGTFTVNPKLPPLTFSACINRSGGACASAPTGILDIRRGDDVVASWASDASVSCTRTRGPADMDGLTGPGPTRSDNTITELVPTGSGSVSDVYEIDCNNTFDSARFRVGVTASNPLPILTASNIQVLAGENVTLSWDTENFDETLCSLSGGSISTNPLLTNGGDVERGSIPVRVDAQTLYTLGCPHGTTTKRVYIHGKASGSM